MDICVVLVTYNRCAALKKTLEAYESQRLLPRYILVVDNHSSDGTAAMLEAWQREKGRTSRVVLTLSQNEGGSGGFYAGMEHALSLACEWILLSDDDALPAPDALERLQDFAREHLACAQGAAALCGAVISGERIATGHRARVKRLSLFGIKDAPVPEKEYQRPYFEVDFFSYIGSCIKASALHKAGLCCREFFLYSDDFEHALRVRREGALYCVPSARFFHEDNNPYTRAATWRDYYATRNLLVMYRRHFGKLAAARRALLRRLTALRACNAEKYRVVNAAIRDAKKERLGVHPLYRPGWEAKKK